MRQLWRWNVAALVCAVVSLAACQPKVEPHDAQQPVELHPIEGTDLNRLTLTDAAIERLALVTGQVREAELPGTGAARRVVPYSALIYDPQGQPWVYTSPEPRTFVRHRVEVDRVRDSLVVLADGPPIGTEVVTIGAAELYGAEFMAGR